MKIEVEIIDNVMQWKQMPESFKNGIYEVEIKNMESRTMAQHRSYFLWLTMIANKLNNENITTTQILRPNISWTSEKVKEMFTAPLIKALFGVNSSTKLEKGDFDMLINTMIKSFGERGVQLPEFPSSDFKR